MLDSAGAGVGDGDRLFAGPFFYAPMRRIAYLEHEVATILKDIASGAFCSGQLAQSQHLGVQ